MDAPNRCTILETNQLLKFKKNVLVYFGCLNPQAYGIPYRLESEVAPEADETHAKM